jgi:hypothetical protein
MGRTWLLRGTYHEGVPVVDALAGPLLSRSVRAGAGGLLNRRTDVSIDTSYSNGQLISSGAENSFTSFDGTARLRFALTRALAAHADYSYYRYTFDSMAGLPALLAMDVRRHSVRAGITLWVPIYTPRQYAAR